MGNRFMPAIAHSFGRKIRRFQLGVVLIGGNQPVIAYPLTLAAAGFARAERMAAGKYEFELADVWPTTLNTVLGVTVPAIYAVGVTYSSTAENEDLYAQGPQTSVSGTTGRFIFTVRTKFGAVNTDPIGGGGGGMTLWCELETAP